MNRRESLRLFAAALGGAMLGPAIAADCGAPAAASAMCR